MARAYGCVILSRVMRGLGIALRRFGVGVFLGSSWAVKMSERLLDAADRLAPQGGAAE